MVLNYHSNAGVTTEFGVNWSVPYHRFAEGSFGNIELNNPQGEVLYTAIRGGGITLVRRTTSTTRSRALG